MNDIRGEIARLKAQNLGWAEIGERLNMTPDKARGLWRRHKNKKPPLPTAYLDRLVEVIHENKRPVEELSHMDCLNGFKQAQDFRDNFSIGYRHVKCRIDADAPIAITCISDVHIGSPHTDYDAFANDINFVIGDPRFYLMKGGDWADKMGNFKDAQARTGQLHPETIQLLAVEKILDALNGRVVAAIGGNHDRMDAKVTGVNSEYFIHRGRAFPYMPTGGLVELTVGKQAYRILWTHQYGAGNSRLNPHNVFRWLRHELASDCDIYITEHHHDPSIMVREYEEFSKRRVVEIRTGSYKVSDPFSQQYYKEGRLGPQVCVLFPDRKKIVPMHGDGALGDAAIYLDGCQVTKDR